MSMGPIQQLDIAVGFPRLRCCGATSYKTSLSWRSFPSRWY